MALTTIQKKERESEGKRETPLSLPTRAHSDTFSRASTQSHSRSTEQCAPAPIVVPQKNYRSPFIRSLLFFIIYHFLNMLVIFDLLSTVFESFFVPRYISMRQKYTLTAGVVAEWSLISNRLNSQWVRFFLSIFECRITHLNSKRRNIFPFL